MQIEEINNVFCRVCLKPSNDSSQTILTKEILKILPIKIELPTSEETHICRNCKERLEKCHTFRLACVDTDNFIKSIIINDSDKKWDIIEIYLNKNENKNIFDVPADHQICRICLGLVKSKYCTPLIGEKQNMLKSSIEKCFPDIDLYVTINPCVCNTCYGLLQEYICFITDCTNTEAKINNFYEINKVDSDNQVNLASVVEFTARNVINDDICDIVRKYCNDGELSDMKLDQLMVDPHEFDVKCEQIDTEVNVNSTQIKTGDEQYWIAPCEIETYKFENCNHTVGCDCGSNLQLGSNSQLYSNYYENNANNTKYESLTGTSNSLHHCKMCPFKTQHKSNLKRHFSRHKSTSDQNKIDHVDPSLPNTFQETDKDPLEVPMYSCDLCSYQSKHKFAVNRHKIVHKDDSQVTIYRCEVCPYETKYKNYLKQHKFTHQDSEAVTYRCETCPYHTKRKDLLRQHVALHVLPDPNRVMYHCATCSYKTAHKKYLSRHLLIHKDEPDMLEYQCEFCSYKTKLKFRLKKHNIVHKDNSEVKNYSCKICKFETRYKSSLKSHELSHKDDATAVVYHCEECSYRTKRQECLEQHTTVHTSKAVYNCEKCSFKTTYKDSLRRHLFTHKDQSELKLYQCEVCPYKTKYSFGLKRHMIVHADFSQVTTYHCEICGYKTKYKFSHNLHRLSHKNGSGTV